MQGTTGLSPPPAGFSVDVRLDENYQVVVIEGVVPKSSFERGEVVHEMNART